MIKELAAAEEEKAKVVRKVIFFCGRRNNAMFR